jgi:CRISPR-associated protein Csh2
MGNKILLRQELDDQLEKEQGEQGFKMLNKLAVGYIDIKNTIPKIKRNELLADHIDIRLFGILFVVGKENFKSPEVKAGLNFKQIGPVQFAIGQSLNTMKEDTDIIRIGMTSLVPNTKNEAGISKGGSFGEKWIVRYAFIQHHGFVNNNIAIDANLTETDVNAMLSAMWNGTDMLATTSKFGQKSRLLVKVNYKGNGYIGDLDLMTRLEHKKEETLEDITQITLNLDSLLDTLKNNKTIIDNIEFQYNPVLKCRYGDKIETFGQIIDEWTKDSGISISKLDFLSIPNKEQK